MGAENKIKACKDTNCGWKCCNFASDGYVVILPKELEGRKDIGHLDIIYEDNYGGKKARCTAKDRINCDNGYKPIMCRSYPLWVRSVKHKIVLKSKKCPLNMFYLKDTKEKVFEMFVKYEQEKGINIDKYLSYAYTDRYELTDNEQCDIERLEDNEDIINTITDIEESSLSDFEQCMKSEREDISKSLQSGCSYGVFSNGYLVAYSLCYKSDYGTGYVEKCFVSPSHRGRGYQRKMLQKNIRALVENGVYNIYTMVSPSNPVSQKNFESVGFRVEKEIKYNGLFRYIMRLNI